MSAQPLIIQKPEHRKIFEEWVRKQFNPDGDVSFDWFPDRVDIYDGEHVPYVIYLLDIGVQCVTNGQGTGWTMLSVLAFALRTEGLVRALLEVEAIGK